MESLKQKIKELASQQPELRNQRKTVHMVGERILYPYPEGSNMYNYCIKYNIVNTQSPTALHLNNRHQLRLLYAVQGLLKGKTLQEIEIKNKPNKQPLSYYQKNLDKLVEQYEIVHSN